MGSLWLRYPTPLDKLYYDVFTADGKMVKRLFPTPTGDFSRGTAYVAGSSVVTVRESTDSTDDPHCCPFCRQPRVPHFNHD